MTPPAVRPRWDPAAGECPAEWVVVQLVQAHLQRGRPAAAEAWLRSVFVPDDPLLAFALGYLDRRRARPNTARAHLLRASPDVVAARIELAAIAAARPDPEEGIARLRALARALARRGDDWGLAAALAQIAAAELERGRITRALTVVGRAIRLRTDLGDSLGLGFALQVRAKALYRRGDLVAALSTLREAFAVHDAHGHRRERAVVANNIGLWYLDLADFSQSAEWLRSARRGFHQLGDHWREAAVRSNLAGSYRHEGDLAAALREQRGALALLLAPGTEVSATAIALAELAETLVLTEHADEAESLLARHARLARIAPAAARFQLDLARARTALARGDLGSARARLRRLQASATRLPGGTVTRTLAKLRGAVLVGRALAAAGRHQLALRSLDATDRSLERLLVAHPDAAVRMGLRASHREIQEAMLDTLLPHQPAQAFRRAAGAKARELVLPRRRLRASRGGNEGSAAAIVEYHVSAGTTRVFVVHAGSVQALDLDFPELKLRAAVDRLLDPLHQAAHDSDPVGRLLLFDLGAAAALHRRLLAPALARLPPEVRHLVIIPDGPLHELPFELMVVEAGSDAAPGSPFARFAGAVYVGDRYTLTYAPSSLLLARGSAPGAVPMPPRRVLAMGYSPTGAATLDTPEGPLTLGPLPGAEAEARDIAALFPRSILHLGGDATSAAFSTSAPTSDLVHIAAHARADARASDLSGVVLSGPDGHGVDYLTAARLRRIALPGSLVVLSACDGGRGVRHRGEGVLGLARAFLEAGASAVLASLWPVDDGATHELMLAFYRHLAAGVGRAEALAGARREWRSGAVEAPYRAHPYYWSGFVLADLSPTSGT